MLIVIRPSFEVVKEGRILKKIKHLHLSFLTVIKPPRQSGPFAEITHCMISLRSVRCQVLDENKMFLTEKSNGNIPPPKKTSS
jgi:hypothetical protein